MPSVIGNEAYEMKVHGMNILHFPFRRCFRVSEASGAKLGIPFLFPWGNRLDQQAFWANGKKYLFDMAFGNVPAGRQLQFTVCLPIRPYWRVTEVKADAQSARVTSKLRILEVSRT